MLVLIFQLVIWCHIPEDSLFEHTWRFESSGAWRRVQWQIAAGVSESFAASIFRVWAGQEERKVCALSYDIVYNFEVGHPRCVDHKLIKGRMQSEHN
jgi:hypothetical protein